MAITPGKNPYSLSIRIFSDGFSLFVHDENKALLSVKHLQTRETEAEARFAELLTQRELKGTFNQTRVIIETGLYTLIPDHFSNDSRSMLALQHPYLSDDYPVIENQIDGHGMTVVFATEPGLLKALRMAFPEIIPQLHLNTFLRTTPESARVILWVRGGEIDLLLYDQDQWMLMNSFNITSTEDIIYYTMNLFREFGLNRNEFALWAFIPENAAQGFVSYTDLSAGLKPFFGNINNKLQTTWYEDYQW